MADFLAIPAADRWHEFVDGQIIEKAMPVGQHGYAQGKIRVILDDYDGPEGKGRPGGWWFVIDTEVDFPQFKRRFRPDWVCEIISPEKRRYDAVEKRRYYAEAGIPFYWLLDYEQRTLTVLKLSGSHYVTIGEAANDDAPRFAPFDLAEIPLPRLFPR